MSAALSLIAAHMIGDYVTQTNAMAKDKRGDRVVRAMHVLSYSFPFALIYLFARNGIDESAARKFWMAAFFWAAIAVPHFVVDSFNWSRPDELSLRFRLAFIGERHISGCDICLRRCEELRELQARVDPWPPKAIMVDQSLHAACIALAAAAFGL